MLADGLNLVKGSIISNARINSGASLPVIGNNGELFFLTSGDVGLYVFKNSQWRKVFDSTLTSGVTAGTYTKVTVNSTGFVTSGTTLSSTDIPNLDASKITSGVLTVGTTGNAATATRLLNARTINGVPFDGTQNITIYAQDSTSRIASSEKGQPNGVATLDATGKIPVSQLPPSATNEILVYDNYSVFPATGVENVLYIAKDTNKVYRWDDSTTIYIEVSPSTGGGGGGGTGGVITGNFVGYLEPKVSDVRWYPFETTTITGVFATIGELSSGTITFDVLKNGISVFGANKPVISPNQYKSNLYNTSIIVTPTDYITLAVVSASGGKNLTIFLRSE